jgi:phosphocarrier protein HPr
MPEREVAIGSKVGLHARPAALFVRAASGVPGPVTIAKDGGAEVDAKSILAVLGLGAAYGNNVRLRAEGDGADAALDALADLLAQEMDR